ncbi:hypothetical protein CONPUDRAFT_108489 [Coniophora puteana RWD-64-598 SS2]|uniref:Glycosyltransferase family 32 protein n=1 Tax=Coniophora puteana (strain RWD-64-598) TaxID=741705 RepID=A0A5M3MH36_CONPW|nr:uncharacterized protein CONPUDRAFT_108489 [Coniophora puteana RWD-64-598 SS2]EIW78532.1 hypothetical protein CONPUDRAFT_108489 [Coniophora puteana RWD-64-598 SS2]
MAMRLGTDCYDFAGSIKSAQPQSVAADAPGEKRIFHTYWRVDLAPFSERQSQMLRSFFATQRLHTSRLILWTNGPGLDENVFVKHYLDRYPDNLEVKVVDMQALAQGTAMADSPLLGNHGVEDTKAWVDGDIVRLLVIWANGGTWVDMDSLLTRDLSPLLDGEWVSQWDCYDKLYRPLNGALMSFHKHSPYLCGAFELMASGPPPRADSTDWGSTLYLRLWRILVRLGGDASVPLNLLPSGPYPPPRGAPIRPFKILPWCFSDGRSCRLDSRLPDPFEKDGGGSGRWWREKADKAVAVAGTKMGKEVHVSGSPLDRALHQVFAVHLHNQWEKSFPKDGWVERLMLDRYTEVLGDGGSKNL